MAGCRDGGRRDDREEGPEDQEHRRALPEAEHAGKGGGDARPRGIQVGGRAGAREAEEARAAIGAGLPAEQRDDYAALPLSEALEKFIAFCLEMNRITPTTRDDYHYSALHIERDELGLVPVNEVTTDDVNAWSRRRIALGTAPDTLNKSFKLGKRLYAVLLKRSNDTIGRNPFDGALAPRVIARPRNALRSDLVPKLNSVTSMMPDSTFRRAVVLALHTGMRIGEVCGLRWCDVDFESGLITVRHSVAYVKDRAPSSRTPRTTT
jgi:integrase